ncbi:MAG TPA: alpha-amylase/4-alpha-glucanotransferase domain-containing protein [bacterium]|nr:alpha-amylase/4-alpha-glucanotransferase domain-containing protein [bacterium]
MHRLALALVIHNHQPVGNFDHVFASATDLAYEPMVAALERHPRVRLALHYTGPLLDWLRAHRPEVLGRVRGLVARGQVEVLTGGYYEPVLAIIPDADKRGQIEKLTRAVAEEFGGASEGLWLAERIWEPHLARPIGEAGPRYTIVDDTHFHAVGLEDAQLLGYYITEEEGVPLALFASLRRLRYLIPWADPADVIAYLRTLAETDVRPEGRDAPLDLALMGDDGEKFGLWPTTHALCWERGWVERFLDALEATPWLDLVAPAEYLRTRPAAGRIYLPTGTYDEMAGWALGPVSAGRFALLRNELDGAGRAELTGFVRGGFWRHFLVKYGEVNTMHHLGLRAGRKIHTMPAGDTRARALDELWAGECNCPYWHGVFGGVYLPHIRGAAFGHLIAAEAIADRAARPGRYTEGEAEDLDGDGRHDVRLATDLVVCTVSPGRGGSVIEWDDRPARRHLGNVMTRRPEAYHEDLRRAAEQAPTDSRSEGAHAPRDASELRPTAPGLSQWLIYDRVQRPTLRMHLWSPAATTDQVGRDEQDELGGFAWGEYAWRLERGPDAVRLVLTRAASLPGGEAAVERTLEIAAGQRALLHTIGVRWTGDAPLDAVVAEEWDLGIFGAPEEVALDDAGTPRSLYLPAALSARDLVRISEGHSGLSITLRPSAPAAVWTLPLFTISNSEGGFEKNFQGVALHLRWALSLLPGRTWTQTTRAEVAGADHA